MFSDEKFKLKCSVDKRGRPIKATSGENLRRYYDMSSGDSSSGSDAEEDTDADENDTGDDEDLPVKQQVDDPRFKLKQLNDSSGDKSEDDDGPDDDEYESENADNNSSDGHSNAITANGTCRAFYQLNHDASSHVTTVFSALKFILYVLASDSRVDYARGEGLVSSSSDDDSSDDDAADSEQSESAKHTLVTHADILLKCTKRCHCA